MRKQGSSLILTAVRETAEGLHKAGSLKQDALEEISLLCESPTRAAWPSSKDLGDDGEKHTCVLLKARGFDARLLQVNARTYDVEADEGFTAVSCFGESCPRQATCAARFTPICFGTRNGQLRVRVFAQNGLLHLDPERLATHPFDHSGRSSPNRRVVDTRPLLDR